MARNTERLARVLAGLALGALPACGSSGEDPASAQQAVDAWVAAVNDRDWDRACELDSDPGADCVRRTERAFGREAGSIRTSGRHQSGESLLYGIELPTGSGGLSVERAGDGWRVHPEVTIIR